MKFFPLVFISLLDQNGFVQMYMDGKYQKNPRDIPIHPTKISGVLWSSKVFQICLKSEASLFTPFHLFFVAFKKIKFPASSDGYPPARWQKKLISLKVAPGRSTAALLAITQVSHYFDPTFFLVLLVLSGDILAFFSFSEEVSGSGPTAVGHFDPLALSMLLNFNIQ